MHAIVASVNLFQANRLLLFFDNSQFCPQDYKRRKKIYFFYTFYQIEPAVLNQMLLLL